MKVSVSFLSSDNIPRDLKKLNDTDCDYIHVDIMDAHFVPNLAYSPDVVRCLKKVTSLPLDVHLRMISNL